MRLLDCTGKTSASADDNICWINHSGACDAWNDFYLFRFFAPSALADDFYHSGLDRFEARKKVWSDLEEVGLAVKKESHVLRVPRSQRGGEV